MSANAIDTILVVISVLCAAGSFVSMLIARRAWNEAGQAWELVEAIRDELEDRDWLDDGDDSEEADRYNPYNDFDDRL